MDESRCHACGSELPADSAFCMRCGAAVQVASTDRPDAAASGWALATAGMAQPQPAGNLAPNVEVQKEECAGWWQRLGGSMLDGILLVLLLGVVAAVVAGVAYLIDPTVFDRIDEFFADSYYYDDPYGQPEYEDESFFWVAIFALAFITLSLAWETFWIRSSTMGKPGQRIAGFRVVRASDASRVSTGRAFGRACAKLLYNVPQFGGLLSVASAFTIALADKKQGVHDLMGGTACIRSSAWERRAGGLGPISSGSGYHPPITSATGAPLPPGVIPPPPLPPGVTPQSPPPRPPEPPPLPRSTGHSGPFA